jgi:nucleoside-diphosphate-sugar epimerase
VTRSGRAVVTGASGYVGRGLVSRLLREGLLVRALVQPGTEDDLPHATRIDAVVGDLLDVTAVDECVSGADVVFHLAGLMPHPSQPDLEPVNVHGTQVVVRAAVSHGVSRLVFLSSAAVYAPAPQAHWPLDEDARLRRRSGRSFVHREIPAFMRSLDDYAWSKREAELIIERAHARHGLGGCVIRSTEIYGPWRRWFASFLERARHDPGLLRQPGTGIATMQWVHADDLCELLLRAGCHDSREVLVVNAAGPEVFSERDLARLALPELRLPPAVRRPTLKYSVERARRRLGWVPEVHLAEGLSELVARERRVGT